MTLDIQPADRDSSRARPPEPSVAPKRSVTRSLLGVLGALALLVLVVSIWRALPEGWASAARLGALLQEVRGAELGFVFVCASYALLASVFVPVTALIAAVALVYDPPRAFAYALSGSLLSAMLSFGVGRIASERVLRLMSGPRLAKLRDQLHAHALKATVVARLLPVGNFTAINMFAGAIRIPFLPFMLGNLVGMVFGIAALTLLADRLARTIAAPTPANVGLLLLLAIALLGSSLGLARVFERRADR